MTRKEQIQGLQDAIFKLDEQHLKLSNELNALKKEEAFASSKFKLGDIIQWNAGTGFRRPPKIMRGKIVDIIPGWKEPDFMVATLLKGGGEGKQRRVYASYHKPEKAP